MRYKATIKDFYPIEANHIIELDGERGELLGLKALNHWRDAYGGSVRAKLVDIEICQEST